MKRVALNGFGRIGKNFLRAYIEDSGSHKHFTLVAINIGPADIQAVPYMVIHDSLLGKFAYQVAMQGNELIIGQHKILILQETDALKLPWKKLQIDFVVDATGHYTHASDAQQHITSGAQKVIITAPAHGEDITVVMGVNEKEYRHDQVIISLGSCTTNALVPLIHVVKMHTTIKSIIASTVHAYTNSQALLDVNPEIKDLRKSRAAALNIIPATTGAAISVATVFPELKNMLSANAFRVPTPVVSLADITFIAEKSINLQEINAWFTSAEQGALKNIVATTSEQLVSTDFQGDSHSVTFDKTLTLLSGPLVRLYGWYDNEWGYSNRIKDFLCFVASR